MTNIYWSYVSSAGYFTIYRCSLPDRKKSSSKAHTCWIKVVELNELSHCANFQVIWMIWYRFRYALSHVRITSGQLPSISPRTLEYRLWDAQEHHFSENFTLRTSLCHLHSTWQSTSWGGNISPTGGERRPTPSILGLNTPAKRLWVAVSCFEWLWTYFEWFR